MPKVTTVVPRATRPKSYGVRSRAVTAVPRSPTQPDAAAAQRVDHGARHGPTAYRRRTQVIVDGYVIVSGVQPGRPQLFVSNAQRRTLERLVL